MDRKSAFGSPPQDFPQKRLRDTCDAQEQEDSNIPLKKQKQTVSVKVKWTDEETKYLKDILDQYHNTTPEWKKVSSLLSDVFPNQRAAKSCQTHAARMKLLDHVDVHIKPGKSEAGCQTEMTFGPEQKVYFMVEESFQPDIPDTHYKSDFLRQALLKDDSVDRQPIDIPVQNVIDSQANDEIIHSYDVDDRTLGNSMDNNFEENRQLEREMLLVEIPMTPAGDNIPHVPVLKPKVTDEHNYNKNGQENTAKKQSHVGAPKKRLQKFLPIVERLTVKPTTLSFLTPKECLNLLSVIKTGNIKSISTQILSVSALRKQIITDIINLVGKRPEQMLNKKKGFVSVLMEKDFKALETVKFEDVLIEFQEKFPELLDMIVAIMLPKDETSVANVVPRLAMIYGIIMQTRHHELSRMQRVVSMCLADNICDQSVYDRLNRIGVSTSYTVALSTINQLGKRYPDLLINAMKEGKYIRLVGDNVNFSVGTSHETKTNHKHMVHMFTSTALISDHHYLSKPKEPEIDLNQLSFEHILLQPQEYIIMRNDIVNIVIDLVVQFLPQLSFLKPNNSDKISTTCQKTVTVPLPCLPYNEQYLQDDVKILTWYQNLFQQVITGSNVDPNTKFQIGGDQLTRERLTQAMLLRYGNINPNDEFKNVGRCVAEFFHLGMNFLEKVIFAEMWNKTGLVEAGTLRGECERISRKGVDTNVMNAYEEDKKYVSSYVTSNLVVAVMHFFGMETENDNPVRNCPRAQESSYDLMGKFVDKYIFPVWSGENDQCTDLKGDVCDDQNDMGSCQTVKVTLANGMVLEIPMTTPAHAENKENKPDKIKDYAHYGLEVGMTFIYFLQNVKKPNRNKMLPLLKMMMLQLRGHSMNAKYPKEILRMLVQQYSVMGLQDACQVFQACFINTTGKSDGHVPADLVQEWNVKECKKHIKHMYSNKIDANICNRTSALPSIHTIADNFDTEACTIIRSKKHTRKQNDEDELLLIQDMKKIRPFEYTSGRSYKEFNTIPRSIAQKVDGQLLLKWFNKNRRTFFI